MKYLIERYSNRVIGHEKYYKKENIAWEFYQISSHMEFFVSLRRYAGFPHGSSDTKKISDYLVKFAIDKNLR